MQEIEIEWEFTLKILILERMVSLFILLSL